MIEVKDLIKFYGTRKVLHGLSFSIAKGKICGFLGPNGSGKTTTMDILAGLLGPSSGAVKVCDLDVITQTQQVKALIGYLPDNPPLYKEMHVQDFVTHVAQLHRIKSSEIKKHVGDVMEECGVGHVKKRIIGNLSKGYRQRVALCAALVHKPQVLILDEPTEGLDPNQIVHIRTLIQKLANERTVILSSHILSEVQATCHQAIIINNGHIVAQVSLESREQKQSEYVYTFASKTDAALAWFQQRNFISNAKISPKKDNSILVQFSKEFWDHQNNLEDIAKVTEQIIAQNFPLVGIEEKREGLEEIFFDVLRTQPNSI